MNNALLKFMIASAAVLGSFNVSSNNLWNEPQDTTVAMNNPDLYAWQLFTALNWPGNKSTCSADSTKKIGDPGSTTWELWPSKQDMFLAGAKEPKSWSAGCNERSGSEKKLEFSGQMKALMSRGPNATSFEKTFEAFILRPDGPFTTAADEEVRLNQSTYEFIRSNKLYSLNEQERLVKSGVKTLVFPLNSKEVKAHWVIIEEADKPRYHWAEIVHEGKKEIWGLVGLHIITRDMPRWFWSTFEHVDNEKRWPEKFPDEGGFRGWVVASSDSASCPPNNLNCNKIPKGFGLEGTKWENYRLRGTQIDWVDHKGEPTILPNSKIEGGFDQKTMSCISCHALAVKGASGNSMPIRIIPGTFNAEGMPHGYIGALNPKLFQDANGNPVPYLGLDFIWSLRNAQREE